MDRRVPGAGRAGDRLPGRQRPDPTLPRFGYRTENCRRAISLQPSPERAELKGVPDGRRSEAHARESRGSGQRHRGATARANRASESGRLIREDSDSPSRRDNCSEMHAV